MDKIIDLMEAHIGKIIAVVAVITVIGIGALVFTIAHFVAKFW